MIHILLIMHPLLLICTRESEIRYAGMRVNTQAPKLLKRGK